MLLKVYDFNFSILPHPWIANFVCLFCKHRNLYLVDRCPRYPEIAVELYNSDSKLRYKPCKILFKILNKNHT
jgi:hypothetical protein